VVSFVAILLQIYYKVSVGQNYENIMRFDKVIAKIIRVQFLCLTDYPFAIIPKRLQLIAIKIFNCTNND